MKHSKIKKQIIIAIVTIIICLISHFLIQPRIFLKPEHKGSYIFIRFLFLIFIYSIINGILYFINKYKHDSFYKKWLKYSIIYLIIMIVFLLCLWPGHWVWDDFSLFSDAINSRFSLWHSYITMIYMSFAYMLIPFQSGLIIFQIVIISILVGYFISFINEISNKKIFVIICFLIFLLPAVILNNFYPMRIVPYSYLLLFTFVFLYREFLNKSELSFVKFFYIFILSSILLLWRSEGIIFIVFIPILIFVVYRKNLNVIKILLIFITLLLTVFMYKKITNYNSYFKLRNDEYGLTIYVNPLSLMLNDNLKGKNIGKDIKSINKVLKVDVLKKYPDHHESKAFWTWQVITDDFQKHLSEFKKAYIDIIINNPFTFLKYRINTFIASSGIEDDYTPLSTGNLTYYYNDLEVKEWVVDIIKNNSDMHPLNNNLRNTTEKILLGVDENDVLLNKYYQKIFWNVIPMLLLMLLSLIISLIKKANLLLLIELSLCAKTIITFLTAPASYFMYYLPEYICAPVLFVISIIVLRRCKDVKTGN